MGVQLVVWIQIQVDCFIDYLLKEGIIPAEKMNQVVFNDDLVQLHREHCLGLCIITWYTPSAADVL